MPEISEMYEEVLNALVDAVLSAGTTEDAIACLAVHDVVRKRLDRAQADPPKYRRGNQY